MNKAMLVSIKSKWLEMILEGKKTFEFRNWKADKGTVIYFYCTKAKPYLHKIEHLDGYHLHKGDFGAYYLNGKVVAKAAFKRVVEVEINDKNIPLFKREDGLKEFMGIHYYSQGYTNQRYAIELEQVEAIEPREISSFYKWKDYQKEYNRLRDLGLEQRCSYGHLKHNKIGLLTKAPQSRVWVLEEENEKR